MSFEREFVIKPDAQICMFIHLFNKSSIKPGNFHIKKIDCACCEKKRGTNCILPQFNAAFKKQNVKLSKNPLMKKNQFNPGSKEDLNTTTLGFVGLGCIIANGK